MLHIHALIARDRCIFPCRPKSTTCPNNRAMQLVEQVVAHRVLMPVDDLMGGMLCLYDALVTTASTPSIIHHYSAGDASRWALSTLQLQTLQFILLAAVVMTVRVQKWMLLTILCMLKSH